MTLKGQVLNTEKEDMLMPMSIEKMLEDMASIIVAAMKDANKLDEKGNKAAGTRVRKAMQEVKSRAQDIRKAVMEAKK